MGEETIESELARTRANIRWCLADFGEGIDQRILAIVSGIIGDRFKRLLVLEETTASLEKSMAEVLEKLKDRGAPKDSPSGWERTASELGKTAKPGASPAKESPKRRHVAKLIYRCGSMGFRSDVGVADLIINQRIGDRSAQLARTEFSRGPFGLDVSTYREIVNA